MNNTYIRAQQCKVKEAKFPFVRIGTQYWTTKNLSLSVTPQGNLIQEIQANANVEKITNIADREFSSDTGFWFKSNSTISGGSVNITGLNGTIAAIFATINKWYKISFTVSGYTSGSVGIGSGFSSNPSRLITANGTYTLYLLAISASFAFLGQNGVVFDNISVQEISWSGSQELYDGIYAQTSGTVEQKTYAAVKAAAMWSNYNNGAPTGLIYGKLYNWFAVKLFQMDIDYYNAANPTKKWANGFRIPTQAEFQSLSTYLGGDAISGGHLKEAGTTHWNSPNAGADNSSGFSCLGSSYRTDSVFSIIKDRALIWSVDIINSTTGRALDVNSSSSASLITGILYTFGGSIRLIKA